MSDGGGAHRIFGPFWDNANLTMYTSIYVYAFETGGVFTTAKTFWTSEDKTGAVTSLQGDVTGTVDGYFNNDLYDIELRASDDTTVIKQYENIRFTGDAHILSNATSYPGVTALNDYQLAVKRTAGDIIQELGLTDGTAFRRLVSANDLVSKTSAHTAAMNEGTILCDASGAAFTITLPTAAGVRGKSFLIKKTDVSSNAITIDGAGSETIDGVTTKTLDEQFDYILVVSDDTNWIVASLDLLLSNIATLNGTQTFTGLKTFQGVAGLGIRDKVRGLIISRPTAATCDIDADEILLQDSNDYSISLTDINLTVDITADGDSNGLDTLPGTGEAASTWYNLWVIYNKTTDTTQGLISVSATAPTMPTDFTFKAWVGAFRNDASSDIIDFIQNGEEVDTIAVQTWKDGSFTTAAWTALAGADAVTNFFPPTAKRLRFAMGHDASQPLGLSPRSDGHSGSYGKFQSHTSGTDMGGVMPTARWNWFTGEISYAATIYYLTGDADTTLVAIGWSYE